MESPQNQQPQPDPYKLAGRSTAGARISSSELLKGQQQLEIEHAGDVYRLRVTKTGKLILTK